MYNTPKPACTQASVLPHLGPAIPINVEPDALDYTLEAIISQLSPGGGNLHPTLSTLEGNLPSSAMKAMSRDPWQS